MLGTVRRCAWLCGLAAAMACSGSPAAPIPPPALISVTRLSIAGLPAEFTVGMSAQLTARAQYSDGSERVVSDGVTWAARTSQCQVGQGGLATAVTEGVCEVEASLDGARATANLTVLSSRTFTVSGRVVERWGLREPPIPLATVTLQTGEHAGRSTRTDPEGRFEFTGAPKGTIVVRVTAEGFESNTADVDANSPSVTFPLAPSPIIEERVFEYVADQDGQWITARIPFQVRHRGPLQVRIRSNRRECDISFQDIYVVTIQGPGGLRPRLTPCTAGQWREYNEIVDPGLYVIDVGYRQWTCLCDGFTLLAPRRELTFTHPW